jgi:hypothetical protein
LKKLSLGEEVTGMQRGNKYISRNPVLLLAIAFVAVFGSLFMGVGELSSQAAQLVSADIRLTSESFWAEKSVIGSDYLVYLPIIMTPPLTGTIQISANRSQDVTVFEPSVTLMLTVSQPPAEMKLWNGGESNEPTEGWIAFSLIQPWTLPNGDQSGQRRVSVRFRKAGAESPVVTATVFYLQNGDFADGIQGWTVEDLGLGYSVANGNLRLGRSDYDCLNMPFAVSTKATTSMLLPPEPSYKINLKYTIYTYDQLPDPGEAVYDAFEIYLNGNLFLRDGNPNAPLSCSNLRVLNRQTIASLDAYQGQSLLVRLENHSRFDKYYNTYTDVETVWLSK